MLGSVAGAWLDERLHLGFTIWRAACRSSGFRFSSVIAFTVQLLPMALAGLLLGGLVVLICGAVFRHRESLAVTCVAAHAGCALSLPLGLLLCATSLPVPFMLLADIAIAALAAMLIVRVLRLVSRRAVAHP